MKKLKIFVLMLVATLALTGCASRISLPAALGNEAKINSYSYNMSLEVNSEYLDEFTSGYGIPSGKIGLELDGKMKREEGRFISSADVSVSYFGVSLEAPTYFQGYINEFEFELFIGVPGIIKEYIEEGKTNLYLSGSEIRNFFSEIMSEEDYQKFDDSVKNLKVEDPIKIKLANEFNKTFFAYIEENNDEVQKFQEIEGLKTSANGTYTISLSKEDIKNIKDDFLSNPDNYNDFKTYLESIYTPTEALPNAEAWIDSFDETFDNFKEIDLVMSFIIKNKFVTGTKIDLDMTNYEDTRLEVSYNIELSDINEDLEITMPDKDADSTLNVIEILKQLMIQY